MMWLVFAGMLIVSALVVWGIVGIATTLSAPEAAKTAPVDEAEPATRAASLARAIRETATSAGGVARAAAVRSDGERVSIQADLGSLSPAALSELLAEESRLAEEAHERGLERAARLHASIAAGLRQHLDEAADSGAAGRGE